MQDPAADRQRYEQIDLPLYRDQIAPILPARVLDFHAHTWLAKDWTTVPWQTDAAGAKYMTALGAYGAGRLRHDLTVLFPDRPIGAVCFGYPTPAADLAKTNARAADAAQTPGLLPLLITGKGLHTAEQLVQMLDRHVFFGYKVLLNWYGDDC